MNQKTKLEALEAVIFAPRTKGRIRSIRTAFKEYQADKKWGWLKRILIGKD